MGETLGFAFTERADGSVVILRNGAAVTVLRGGRAAQFLDEVGDGAAGTVHDARAQQVMARWTGNYRRGNERVARQHPRNRGR